MIAATVLFLLLAWALGASATSIQLAANKEVEFFDVLQKGDKWGAQFQLVDGSVGFRLSSPEGVIYEGPSESYGSYSLTAKSSGVHTFKFINRDAAPKHIAFSLLGSLAAKTASGDSSRLDPVQSKLQELNARLRMARDEHAFLMEREAKHRKVTLSTNARVKWWFYGQIVLLAGVSYFQIRSLKSFFEVRRLV